MNSGSGAMGFAPPFVSRAMRRVAPGLAALLAIGLGACGRVAPQETPGTGPVSLARKPPRGEPCIATGVPELERGTALAECVHARSRYHLLFGEEAPGADVELSDTMFWQLSASVDRVRLVVPSDSVFALHGSVIGELRSQAPGQGRFLSHELLHLFFWLRTGDPAAIDTRVQYATRAPDWFDEGVAVWGEGDESRAHRWGRLRSLPDSVLDLRRIAAQGHPDLGRERGPVGVTMTRIEKPGSCRTDECRKDPDRIPDGMVVRTRQFASGETVVDTVPEPMAEPPGAVSANLYPLSYGLVRYLHARGGSAAIREVVRRFAGGWPRADSVFVGIPGLPIGLDAIESDWRRWIRSSGPE